MRDVIAPAFIVDRQSFAPSSKDRSKIQYRGGGIHTQTDQNNTVQYCTHCTGTQVQYAWFVRAQNAENAIFEPHGRDQNGSDTCTGTHRAWYHKRAV